MRRTVLFIGLTTIFALIAFAAGCGWSNNASPGAASGKAVASGPAGNNLTATLANAEGVLKQGSQEFTLTFADASGKPVDVGAAALNLHMAAMGSMAAMNSAAILMSTGTPGIYKGKVDVDMAGDWQAQITYEGPAGKGAFVLPVTAR
jgi:hypothetical protein